MTSAPVHHPAWQPKFAGWPATQVPHQQSEPQANVSTLTTQQGSPGQPRHHEPDPESNPSRSLPPGTWTIDPPTAASYSRGGRSGCGPRPVGCMVSGSSTL